MKKISLFLVTCFVTMASLKAQVTVDVNLNVKHIVGDQSEFNRKKYITLHAGLNDGEWPSDEVRDDFLRKYDVYLGRNNGSLPFRIRQIGENPNKKGWPNIKDIERIADREKKQYAKKAVASDIEARNDFMIGGQFNNYPEGKPINTCCGKNPWTLAGNDAAAEFYAHYIKNAYGGEGENKPKYLEVINEPFVHAKEHHTTRQAISEFHVAVAKRVKELNPNIMVGGYTAAYPEYSANNSNFGHWNNNWKRFIDVAGKDMDFFSVHIYDGMARKGTENYFRSGSNMEAMLDMIESYSKIKLGEVKPFVISEYGYFWQNGDIEKYTKEFDWQNLRSFSTIMMQLLEKPDVMLKTMPFKLLKANWWKSKEFPKAKYPYRLFRQKKELERETGDEWVYTELVKFYELWSDVNGTRIDTKASDIDIQADAYIDGKKMYLILNNMETSPQRLKLNLAGLKKNNIKSIKAKHLYEINELPKLDELKLSTDITEVTVAKEATMILEYKFKKKVKINETSKETKIYASTYLQRIEAGKTNRFTFDSKELTKGKQGELVLRLGLGREHKKGDAPFSYPEISFNGTKIKVPTDWRGKDQKARKRFFGVLEIPIPYDLIDDSATNNTVDVTFSDNGGYISSVVLQKFDFSKPIRK